MTKLSAALSPVAILNAVAWRPWVKETRDVAFGPGERDHLDVYAPRSRGPNLPLVVFFYGGGWEEGDRAMYRFVGNALASKGMVTVIPDYRVFPEVRFPAFLEDAARAVRFARDAAAQWGADPGRLVFAGHSAGAHIAAMLALDPQWLGAVGLDTSRDVRGIVGLSGPYDFLPLHSETLKTIFGPERSRPASQPINFARSGAPPALLTAGAGDKVVDPANTTRLAARLRQVGGTVDAHFYPRIGHAAVVGAIAPPLRFLAPVAKDITAFVARVTAPAAALAREAA